MKSTIVKSVLSAILFCFAFTGASLAHPKLIHNVEKRDGATVTCVYKMDDNQELTRYKESYMTYDDQNRPIKKKVRVWSTTEERWIPCQTWTYTYVDNSCIIDLKWQSTFPAFKDEHYVYNMVDAKQIDHLNDKL